MRMKHLVRPAVVAELEDAHMAVGAGAGKYAAAFVRGPADHVYTGGVEGEIEDFGPC